MVETALDLLGVVEVRVDDTSGRIEERVKAAVEMDAARRRKVGS